MIEVGNTAGFIRTVTKEDILAFAEVPGDNNSIHLDEAYAEKSVFKKKIAHGMQ